MADAADVRWFKRQFQTPIERAVAGTPFTCDLVTALACQETGEIWGRLRDEPGMTVARILELCVGDVIDAPKRRAFPTSKADLLSAPQGQAMFDIARQALLDMANHVPGYRAAAAKPHKFCRGYGIFQLDLQFFRREPDYFLERRYADFDACLAHCLASLQQALARTGLQARAPLSTTELAAVAIAYNSGRFRPERGLKQGYFDGTRYYGEAVFDYLRLAASVGGDGAIAVAPGTAALPAPTRAGTATHIVDVEATLLRVRREPLIDRDKPNANVIAHLPDAHAVRVRSGTVTNGFLEIETNLAGAYVHGYAAEKFLRPLIAPAPAPAPPPRVAAPGDILPASLAHKAGAVTSRRQVAGAYSLNEAGQPGRSGTTPAELRAELGAIIDWLAVDKPTHRRYQPRGATTFCNIYAHDFCHLGGVYLPRVWWTPGAVERLAHGEQVAVRYGETVEELRANGLFRWLRDFGPRFGWRQTGTLSKLQQEANQGAIGLLVARRKDEGKPGHIVMVVPETETMRARRDRTGEVVAPLQSEAGAKNYRYRTPPTAWWNGAQFTESACWLHA